MVTAPSERQYPLPLTSNDLHAPSGDNMLSLKKSTEVLGFNVRLTPPTMAASQLPDLIACTAQSMASSDDEQAESMVKLGPLKSNVKETRFANIARQQPVIP